MMKMRKAESQKSLTDLGCDRTMEVSHETPH